MILLMDNFRTYPASDDMLADGGRGGPWTTFGGSPSPSGLSLVDVPTWKTDGSSLRALRFNSNSDRDAPQRDFAPAAVPVVCAQFVVGSSNESANPTHTEACNFVLFQEPVIAAADVSGSVLGTFYGVSVRSTSSPVGDSNRVGVYYTILTAANGSVNSALIGYLKPWTRGRHYHVELRVDHSNPVARIQVYINGVLELDRTYDRDRVNSGLQTLTFKRVMLGGGTPSQTARAAAYSNLVVYTDDAATPFPLGPVDIETISPTAGQGYDGLRAAPNADDSTYATVNPGASLSGSFGDLAPSARPVLAVDGVVRHGAAAGLEPSQITTSFKRGDGSTLAQALTATAPGVPPTPRRVRLPAGLTQADVNAMTFTISAAAG